MLARSLVFTLLAASSAALAQDHGGGHGRGDGAGEGRGRPHGGADDPRDQRRAPAVGSRKRVVLEAPAGWTVTDETAQ